MSASEGRDVSFKASPQTHPMRSLVFLQIFASELIIGACQVFSLH